MKRSSQNDIERNIRCDRANHLLRIISGLGRHFFGSGEAVSKFDIDDRKRIWFTDYWTGKSIYTHYKGKWSGFTGGGTMKTFAEQLRDYISKGKKIPNGGVLGPWPAWYGGGDPWGYKFDMSKVRYWAKLLNIMELQ